MAGKRTSSFLFGDDGVAVAAAGGGAVVCSTLRVSQDGSDRGDRRVARWGASVQMAAATKGPDTGSWPAESPRRTSDGRVSDPAVVERTIRALQVGQFLRSCQHAFTNAAQTTLALQVTGGDQAVVAAFMSRAGSLSSLLELLTNPLVGSLSDNFGRKPIMLAGGMAKFIPYMLCALCKSALSASVTAAPCLGRSPLR